MGIFKTKPTFTTFSQNQPKLEAVLLICVKNNEVIYFINSLVLKDSFFTEISGSVYVLDVPEMIS